MLAQLPTLQQPLLALLAEALTKDTIRLLGIVLTCCAIGVPIRILANTLIILEMTVLSDALPCHACRSSWQHRCHTTLPVQHICSNNKEAYTADSSANNSNGSLLLVCTCKLVCILCMQAIDALKEIFLVALLPDHKLKFFEQQPLAMVPANKEGSRRLLFWYVEDCLKKRYSSFVTGLEECSRDNLEFLKDKALKAMFDLLRSKPEQVCHAMPIHGVKLTNPCRQPCSGQVFFRDICCSWLDIFGV